MKQLKTKEKYHIVQKGKHKGEKILTHYVEVKCPMCDKKRWVIRQDYLRPIKSGIQGICISCYQRPMAEKHHRWKGGQYLHTGGYRLILLRPNDPFYPMARACRTPTAGYVFEHRLVMAKHLGRCLRDWEVVHHINKIKDDNRIENLELHSILGHRGITNLENRVRLLEDKVSQQDKLIRLLQWHIKELNKLRITDLEKNNGS